MQSAYLAATSALAGLFFLAPFCYTWATRRERNMPMKRGGRRLIMKVIIMCGGKGTRLREETSVKPKPMVEIGGRPVLWHIMSIFHAANPIEATLQLFKQRLQKLEELLR